MARKPNNNQRRTIGQGQQSVRDLIEQRTAPAEVEQDPGQQMTGQQSSVRDLIEQRTEGVSETQDGVDLRGEVAGAARGGASILPFMGAAAGGMIVTPEPISTVLGVGLGTAIGLTGQEAINKGVPDAEDLPKSERPDFYAAQVGAASLPIAGGVLGIAKTGARMNQSRIGNFLNGILNTAERNPKAFMAAETTQTGSAALFEAAAEEVAPGESGVRLTAGIAGGILNPTQYAIMGATSARRAVDAAMAGFSEKARRSRAARDLSNIFGQTGEDPVEVARIIRQRMNDSDLEGVTAAQLTGSKTLQSLEAGLAQRSKRFGEEAKRKAQSGFDAMRFAIDRLRKSGDPEALRAAARIRMDYFDSLIRGRIAAAEQKMVELAERITPQSPDEMSRLSRQAEEILGEALSEARRVERDLWSQIPEETTMAADNLLFAKSNIANQDLMPDESINDLLSGQNLKGVRGMINRLSEENGTTTVGEMLKARSRLLSEARKASAENEPDKARMLGNMANSVLDDLSQIDKADAEIITRARDFSRALNQNFNTAFTGQALSRAKTGESRIPPEAMLRKAIGSGKEVSASRMRELTRAVRMGNPGAVDEMMSTQRNFLRFAASRFVRQEGDTITVNERSLENFRKNNEEALSLFPEVDQILSDTASAKRFVKRLSDRGKSIRSRIQKQRAFGRVAESENPVREIGRIVDGPNPERRLRDLVKTAKQDSEEAVLGLRDAALSMAFERSFRDGQFNFTSFSRRLFEPIREGQKSLAQILQENGVMDSETAGRLRQIVDRAKRIQSSLDAKPEIDQIQSPQSVLFDLAARVGGSNIVGATGAGNASGSSIIMAQAGSQASRQILEQIPEGRTTDFLVEAAENPEIMATLLEKPQTARQKIRLSRKLNAYLFSTGLLRGPEEASQERQDRQGATLEDVQDIQLGGR